jgi:hypothetical protein
MDMTDTRNKNLSNQYGRVLNLLTMLKTEFEDLQMNEIVPIPRQKKMRQYGEKVGWILRDLVTDARSQQTADSLYTELNSERSKDLALWLDMGLQCGNLEEVMNTLKQCIMPATATE